MNVATPVGLGISLIATSFLESGRISRASRIWPQNRIFVMPNWHLSVRNFNPYWNAAEDFEQLTLMLGSGSTNNNVVDESGHFDAA